MDQGDCVLNSNISKKVLNPLKGELYLVVIKNKFLKCWNFS